MGEAHLKVGRAARSSHSLEGRGRAARTQRETPQSSGGAGEGKQGANRNAPAGEPAP